MAGGIRHLLFTRGQLVCHKMGIVERYWKGLKGWVTIEDGGEYFSVRLIRIPFLVRQRIWEAISYTVDTESRKSSLSLVDRWCQWSGCCACASHGGTTASGGGAWLLVVVAGKTIISPTGSKF